MWLLTNNLNNVSGELFVEKTVEDSTQRDSLMREKERAQEAEEKLERKRIQVSQLLEIVNSKMVY